MELKKQLILDLMKEYGVSDSTFSAFEGSNFIISDDNNVVTDTLVNRTSKNYKDEFIEDILSGDVLGNTQYDAHSTPNDHPFHSSRDHLFHPHLTTP